MSQKLKLNRKKLIIIAFFIIIILITLIIVLGMTRSMDKGNTNFAKQSEFKSNREKLVDYDEVVMKYGNDVFILDRLSNTLVKYSLKNNTKMTIVNFGNTNYSNHYFIRNNQLIFSYNNATYYSDLTGNNMKRLTNGEVVYMDDDVYMFISHQELKDELYIVSYDNKTFRTTNALSHNIANGKTIQYLKSEGDYVYFTSINDKGNLSIFEVDVKTSSTKVISVIPIDSEYETVDKEVSDITKNNEFYYYIIKEMSPTTYEGSFLNYSYLYVRGITENFEEICADNVGLYLARTPKNKERILFEQASESGDMIWKDTQFEETNYDWKELLYGDVTNYFEFENSNLLMDGQKFVEIKDSAIEYELKKVIRLDDGYYFLIANEYEHSWYHCTEKGENLVKMN